MANHLRHIEPYTDPERGCEFLRDLAIDRGRSERDAENEASELIKQKWNGAEASHTDRTAVQTKANVER